MPTSQTANPPARPTPVEEIAAALERLGPLAGLSLEERLWLAQNGQELLAEPGETLFDEGEPADRMVILLKGEIHVYREHGGPVALFIGRVQPITGLLPFSRMKNFGGQGVAVARVWALTICAELFPAMLEAIPSMGKRAVGVMLDRVREVTRIEQQAEKLTALGKLAGNLAHELNNPASAAQRAAANLVTELRANRENRFRLVNLCLSEELVRRVEAWEQRMLSRIPDQATAQAPPQVMENAADAIAREEELRAWLVALPCDTAWEVAPPLAEQGVTLADLEELGAMLNPEATCVTLQYFVRYLRSRRSVDTLIHSTARIFDLISAIKDYSNMDRAPIQEVDVPAGLDATVRMLQSRMDGIAVVREYEPDLALINAYSGELNQVWTALIENALDAMKGAGRPGRLRLACRMEGELLLIEIHDNGRGIPLELKDRIFEPFFTTKAPGQGLGLGLDNAMRIVHMHRGLLGVRSEPGDTCFRVRLPMEQFQAY
jgi:signal transduction histidine kinase